MIGLRRPEAYERPLQTTIFESDGLYVKQMVAPVAHTVLQQHAHVLSHLTMVAAGKVRISIDGRDDAIYTAPCGVTIEAGVLHWFMTLEDNTILYCIHALATPESLKVLAEHEAL